MFFSSLKRSQTQAPDAEAATPASPAPAQDQEASSSGHNATLFHKLFGRETLPYAGPDHSYENEAWAPEPYVGLFRKKRAVAEEQLPSKTDAQ